MVPFVVSTPVTLPPSRRMPVTSHCWMMSIPIAEQARAAYEDLVVDTRRRIERQIEQFSLRANEARVASKVLEDAGYPADQICLEAQRYDLVMLGQQTFFHPGLEGRSCDTLHKVLRCSPRP